MADQKALVELPVACSGRGEYSALVHYGSRGGEVFSRSFTYSYKDPRTLKDEADVLRDISRMVPARHRTCIVAISLIKRCLHPKTHLVPKLLRRPYYERLFAAAITHEHSKVLDVDSAGSRPVVLPYTHEELQWMPIQQVIATQFGDAVAHVGLRGAEQVLPLNAIVSGQAACAA